MCLAVAILAFAAACDTEEELTWINETDLELGIFFGDSIDNRDLIIGPNSTEIRGAISDLWEDVVVVRDEDGNVLFREEITWDELKAQDFTFVIRQEDIEGELR